MTKESVLAPSLSGSALFTLALRRHKPLTSSALTRSFNGFNTENQ